MPDIIDDESIEDTGTNASVNVGGTYNGVLEEDRDRDWIAVDLEQGQTYVFTVRGVDNQVSALADPSIVFRDPGGNEIATDDDSGPGLEPYLEYTATETGTFFIQVGPKDGGIGAYELSVELADDEPTASADTAATIDVGGTYDGNIEELRDADWIAVELEAGQDYGIRVSGEDSGLGTLADPLLVIVSADGTRLVTDRSSGPGFDSFATFNPTESGTYYIRVTGFGNSNTGTYQVSVENIGDDEPIESISTAATVSVGGTYDGTIEQNSDNDWIAVELVAGQTYTFAVSGEGAVLNPLAILRDPNGIEVDSDNRDGPGNDSYLVYTATETGTFYIDVKSAEPDRESNAGDYQVAVERVDAADDEPTANTDTAATMDVGDTYDGSVSYGGDRDWVKVYLVEGKTYDIRLSGEEAGLGTLEDPNLYLHGPDGTQLASDDNGGEGLGSLLQYTATETGFHYINVGSQPDLSDKSGDVGTYQVSVTAIDDEPTASTDTAATIDVGGTYEGEAEDDDDEDWIAVELEAGQLYRIGIEGRDTEPYTLFDPLLTVYDSNGNALASDDDTGEGRNPLLEFTAPSDGTYYISATGDSGSTGTYRISLESLEDDEPTASVDTAATIDVGGTYEGDAELQDDEDWIAVELEAGQLYRIGIEGRDTEPYTLFDPLLTVYDSNGNALASDDDTGEGRNPLLDFTAPSDGTYYISATGDSGSTGTYRISLENIADDEPTASVFTAATVDVDSTYEGELEQEGDEDWIAVELVAGQEYQIDLPEEDHADVTINDPYLVIYDADGVELETDDNGGEDSGSRIIFTAETSGTYYISASDYYDDAGTYQLSVKDVTDDEPEASVFTAATIDVGGTYEGEIEVGGDEDWIAVELTANVAYDIRVSGADSGSGTLTDPELEIFLSNGTPVERNSDGGPGLDSYELFTPTVSGTYYIGVTEYEDGVTGTYQVSVKAGGTPHFTSEPPVEEQEERDGAQDQSGSISFIDNDTDLADVVVTSAFNADASGHDTPLGTLTLTPGSEDGTYDYVWDVPAGAMDYLAEGDVRQEVFTVTLTDPDGNKATQDITINVTGVNDDAVIGGDTSVTIGEADDGVSGQLTITDLDDGEDSFTAETITGTYGELTINADGSWSYDLNTDSVVDLNDGETEADTITVQSVDGTEQVITVNIEGADDVPDDEPTASVDTAATIDVDGTYDGEIEFNRDYDWIAVELEAGNTYDIAVAGAGSGLGTLENSYLSLLGPDGEEVEADNNGGPGDDSALQYTATESGTYYISVNAFTGDPGTYQVSVENIVDDEPTASIDTAATIDVGGTYEGEIEVDGDYDWIAVELESGETYDIAVAGAGSGLGTLENSYLSLRGPDGEEVEADNNDGPGFDSALRYTATESGTYYIAVNAFTGDPGTYQVSVAPVENDDEPTAGVATVATMDVGSTYEGEAEEDDDEDWIAVELEAGQLYRIGIEGRDTEPYTLFDPLLTVYDSQGNALASDDDNGEGRNPLLDFTAPSDGTYYISATGDSGSTGTYRISLENIVDDEPTASVDTAATIDVGGTYEGEIEVNRDYDWIAVELEAGNIYDVSVSGAGSGLGTLENSYLSLRGPDGEEVEADNNGGPGDDSALRYTATETGTYYIAVNAFTGDPGTYQVSVENIVDDEPTASIDTAATIDVGGTYEGEIEVDGDYDWIAVELESGETYDIAVAGAGSGLGTLENSYLSLRGPDGEEVEADNNGGPGDDSALQYTATETGTYYIAVNAFTGDPGTYQVSVALEGAPYFTTVPSDEDVLEGDGNLEVSGSFSFDDDDNDVSVIDISVAFNNGVGGQDALGDLVLTAGEEAGTYNYTWSVNAGDLDYLVEGEELLEVFTITLSDPDGNTRTQKVTITITGTNDAAIIAGTTSRTIGEDDSGTSGQLTISDPDDNEDSFIAETIAGTYGELSIEADGSWSYDLDNNSVSDLDDGDLVTDLVTVSAADGTEQVITINIQGEDDNTGGGNTGGGNSGGGNTGGGNTNPDPDPIPDPDPVDPDAGELIAGTDGTNVLNGTGLDDQIWARGGPDAVSGGSGNDIIGGGSGADTLDGEGGDDTIFGGEGNDLIEGGAGDDVLFNGEGTDTVSGGADNDTLWGGDGDDILSGGSGEDDFKFIDNNGSDVITDFNADEDTLYFAGLTNGFESIEELRAASEFVDGSLRISLGDDNFVILEGVNASLLTEENVVF